MIKNFLIVLISVNIFLITSVSNNEARIINKGTISTGGSSKISMSNTNYDKGGDNTSYSFGGNMGYFIFNNFELGTSFMYFNYDHDDYTSKNYSIGPILIYHLPLNDSSNIVFNLSAGLSKSEIDDNTDFDFNRDTDGKYISGGVGFEYFLHSKVSIDLGLNFNHTKWDYSGNYDSYDDDTSNSISTATGFKIYF